MVITFPNISIILMEVIMMRKATILSDTTKKGLTRKELPKKL